MGIQIVKTGDIKGVVSTKLDNLHKEFKIAISDEVKVMIARTGSGIDVDGKQFKPYTEAYRRFKVYGSKNRKTGRVRGGGRKGSPPDLTYSGAMLRAIDYLTYKVGDQFIGKVFFRGAKEGQKAKGNLKHRQFFGFSKDQIAKIHQRIKQSFK